MKFALLLSLLVSLMQTGCNYDTTTTCNDDIAVAAQSLSRFVIYDPSYVPLNYPNGDVPKNRGVCTDVVIRTLRKIGIDLQVEVYRYRKSKGLETDTNIDHRRVPEMCAYFADSPDWEIVDEPQPGDVIWWITPAGTNHVGVVTLNGKVMHNYGTGQSANVYPNRFKINHIYRLKCYGTDEENICIDR